MRRDQWNPSGEELVSILDEMRPVVAAFAARDARLLVEWAAEAGAARRRRVCRRRRAFVSVPG